MRAAAREAAIKPLLGFVDRFGPEVGLPLLRSCEQVADYSCNIAADKRNAEHVRKGKGFDDPVESGLAFLTAMTFVGGMSHAWGDGTDGTIVGPGPLRE